MANDGVSLEALMNYEVEACLACVSTKERQQSLKDFENRKGKEKDKGDEGRQEISPRGIQDHLA